MVSESEEKVVKYISERIKSRLLGEGSEFDRLYVKPSRKFFVGNLLPQDQDNKKWKSIINPSAMGVEFYINNSSILDISISFDVYYRAYPTLNELKELKNVNKDLEDNDPLIKVYKREKFFSRASINLKEEKEKSLKKYYLPSFNKLLEKIKKDPMLFRNKGNATWKPNFLDDEKQYNEYLKSRNGSYLTPAWDFDVIIENIQSNNTSKTSLIKLLLVNTSTSKRIEKNDLTLFNAKLVIQPNFPLENFNISFIKNEYDEYYKSKAKGIGCVVDIENNTIYAHHIPIVKYHRRYPKSSIGKLSFQFVDLINDPITPSESLLTEMKKYLKMQKEKVNSLSEAKIKENPSLFQYKIQTFEDEIKLIEKTVNIFKNDKEAYRAFTLMNKVMSIASKNAKGWYVYQIAFILANISSFINRNENNKVEVLKVPTGGGKTFCYIGLTIFAAFYERLKGKSFGVTAWIKFPLRMLSLQQLEIIASYVCFANKVKLDEKISGDDISIGYFVGSKNTPNSIEDAFKRLDSGNDFRILSNCPFCSNEIILKINKEKGRIYHECSKGHKLPIIVVDYEIYRVIPTIIVSTLDKVTSFNFNYRGKTLLGSDVKICTNEYGYNGSKWCLSSDIPDITSPKCSYYNNGSCIADFIRGHPPSLLIQDEMHMLREDHGSLDALYETLLDEIIYKMTGSTLKIISATATISGINNQVKELYDRIARVFPTIFIDDDFYFEKSKDLHRLVIGVIPHARAIGYSVYQIIIEYQKEIQNILLNLDNVAKLLNVPAQDLRDIILKKYYTSIIYYRSKREAAELFEGVKGIVNEYLKQDKLSIIREKEIELITGEKVLSDLRKLMDRIETNDINNKIKLISATMAISHGIDFDQLNMMIFQSMPRSISEYIQAMSRVGRKYPALVFVVFHGTRARDNSYYKYFNVLHDQIEKLIEVVPLSRWPKNAIKLMTPAAILAVLHTYFANKKYQNKENRFDQINYNRVKELLWALNYNKISSDDISRIIKDGFKISQAPNNNYINYFENSINNTINIFLEQIVKDAPENESISNFMLQKYKTSPIWSFRGVDDQVDIVPTSSSSIVESYLRTERTIFEPTGEEKNVLSEEQKEDLNDEGFD